MLFDKNLDNLSSSKDKLFTNILIIIDVLEEILYYKPKHIFR